MKACTAVGGAIIGKQSHDGKKQLALARAGLPNNPETLAAVDVKGHIIDGTDFAVWGLKSN
jgi:hypothetical protein